MACDGDSPPAEFPAVTDSGNGATFINATIGEGVEQRLLRPPIPLRVGGPGLPFSLTFLNSGTKIWKKGVHALGSQCPTDGVVGIGTNRIVLQSDVLPGSRYYLLDTSIFLSVKSTKSLRDAAG